MNLGGEAFVFTGEFIGSTRIVEQAARDVIRIERVAQIARLLRNLLCRSRVIPETRLRGLMVEIDELGFGVLDMQVFTRRSQTLGNIVDIQVFFLSHSSNHSEFKNSISATRPKAGTQALIQATARRCIGPSKSRYRSHAESSRKRNAIRMQSAPHCEIGRQAVYDIHHRAAPLGGAILHHLLKPWHFLNFFPLPHGQGSFGFTFT